VQKDFHKNTQIAAPALNAPEPRLQFNYERHAQGGRKPHVSAFHSGRVNPHYLKFVAKFLHFALNERHRLCDTGINCR
jgi:hypothetical protein